MCVYESEHRDDRKCSFSQHTPICFHTFEPSFSFLLSSVSERCCGPDASPLSPGCSECEQGAGAVREARAARRGKLVQVQQVRGLRGGAGLSLAFLSPGRRRAPLPRGPQRLVSQCSLFSRGLPLGDAAEAAFLGRFAWSRKHTAAATWEGTAWATVRGGQGRR